MTEVYSEDYADRRIQVMDDGVERHYLVDGEEYDLPGEWGAGDLNSLLALIHGEIDSGRM